MNLLYPSMMCVKPADVNRICGIFEKTGIAGLHIDIMDGSFVPNFTLGVDYCRYLHEITALPLDIHLMIDRPEEKLTWFPVREGDMVQNAAEQIDDSKSIDEAFLKAAVRRLEIHRDGCITLCLANGIKVGGGKEPCRLRS